MESRSLASGPLKCKFTELEYIYILVNFEFSEISCHDDPDVQNFGYLKAFGNNRANGLDARRMSCARYFYRAIPSLALSYDF